MRSALIRAHRACAGVTSAACAAARLDDGGAPPAPAPAPATAPATAPAEVPLEGVTPFVGLFLDDASRARLAARWPAAGAARSAEYVVLEPSYRCADPKKPAIYAPLMQEKASATPVGMFSLPSGAVVVRADCALDGSPLPGADGFVTCLSFGHIASSDAAAEGACVAAAGAAVMDPVAWDGPPLTGVLCKSEFYARGECHLPPMLKCPLCQFMEDSPCAAVFKLWEDCLNANEKTGGTDEERQERFTEECALPTLALKDCVEGYPDFFGEMFGGAGAGEKGDEPAAPDAEPGAAAADAAAATAAEPAAPPQATAPPSSPPPPAAAPPADPAPPAPPPASS